MTVVHESRPLPAESGGKVILRLLVAQTRDRTEIRIEREERLAHKTLSSTVLRIEEANAVIEPLARSMTTIAHELERLHVQGYALRERAGGGWSGKWQTDLVRSRASRAVLSWPSEMRRPLQELATLEAALVALDVPRARLDAPEDPEGGLAAAMRRHGAEVRRNHAVDAAIAANPELPAAELLEALEEQGLLSPADDE